MKIKIDLADNFIDVWNEEKEIWERYVKAELEEEKKIPEKLYHCYTDTDNDEIEFLVKNINNLVDRYNDLLDYLKRKGE